VSAASSKLGMLVV